MGTGEFARGTFHRRDASELDRFQLDDGEMPLLLRTRRFVDHETTRTLLDL
jgi:hypothetical protein